MIRPGVWVRLGLGRLDRTDTASPTEPGRTDRAAEPSDDLPGYPTAVSGDRLRDDLHRRRDSRRDGLSIMLGDGGEDLQRQSICHREVARHELGATVHNRGDKAQIAREPVEFRHDQRRAGGCAMRQCCGKLRPVIALAAFSTNSAASKPLQPCTCAATA